MQKDCLSLHFIFTHYISRGECRLVFLISFLNFDIDSGLYLLLLLDWCFLSARVCTLQHLCINSNHITGLLCSSIMNKNVMLSSSIVILDLGLFIGWSRSRSRLLAGVGAGAGLSILRLRTPGKTNI